MSGRPRDVPPPPGPVRPFHFPAFRRHQLSNGLTVVAARSPRAPVVDLALVFPAGAEQETADSAGLASMTASLIDEGTEDRDAIAIATAVADLGGRLASGADWDVGFVEAELLSHHVEHGLALLAELATGATFPGDEIERQRRRRTTELLRRRSDPSYLADERLIATIYGDSPYGRTLLGDEASLARIDRRRVRDFFTTHYGLAGGTLVAAGDLDPDALVARAEAVLGGLDGGVGASPPRHTPPPPGGLRIEIVDRPRAAQTELRLGHVGIERTHADYVPLSLTNTIFGGKFTSRINLNLRERHGFTYGANSRFDTRRGAGPFVVRTAVGTAVAGAALRELLGEIARLRDELVEPAELDDAVRYVVGTFPYTLQTSSGLAERLQTLVVHGLPDDYYDRLPAAVEAVDRETVREMARRHLRPEELVVVAVGPAAELLPQLGELGPSTVHRPTSAADVEAPATRRAAATSRVRPTRGSS
ncbi:MAG TPA: pitrilysin family protein [Thermoanaerobaculia bacterium]|nr:pitrilysin family protein [Thermoanaerobaculia bacterium]